MALSVLEEKLARIEWQCCSLLFALHVLVLALAKLLGSFASFSQAMFPHLLYLCNMQQLLGNHVNNMGGYEGFISLNPASHEELAKWVDHLRFWNGRSIQPVDPNIIITSDASNFVWGSWCKDHSSSGHWSAIELTYINYQELLAAFFSVQSFLYEANGYHILLHLDNSMAIACANWQGATHSCDLSDLVVRLWEWCLQCQCSIYAIHLPGVENCLADWESRTMTTTLNRSNWHLSLAVV